MHFALLTRSTLKTNTHRPLVLINSHLPNAKQNKEPDSTCFAFVLCQCSYQSNLPNSESLFVRRCFALIVSPALPFVFLKWHFTYRYFLVLLSFDLCPHRSLIHFSGHLILLSGRLFGGQLQRKFQERIEQYVMQVATITNTKRSNQSKQRHVQCKNNCFLSNDGILKSIKKKSN